MEQESLNYHEQKEKLAQLLRPQPTVIGIEGGPCSGKTTLVERLRHAKTDREVIILPEAATEHIAKLADHGLTVPELAAGDREGFLAFERDVLQTIISNIQTAREAYAGTDAIIVADRVDIGAYISDDEYRQLLDSLGRGVPPMLDLVDKLYYLPSVAIESPEKYSALKSSNAARYESLEEAQATCRANLRVVARHPELEVAWGGDFSQKIDSLVSSVMEPEKEVEAALECTNANFIIADIKKAYVRGKFLSQSRITQSYHVLDGSEYRLRKVDTSQGEQLHFLTIKSGDGLERRELQRRIDDDEYRLLLAAPRCGNILQKTRYEFLKLHNLETGEYRKWSADYYDAPYLQRWQVEVGLRGTSTGELSPLRFLYGSHNQNIHPTQVRARDLAQVAL